MLSAKLAALASVTTVILLLARRDDTVVVPMPIEQASTAAPSPAPGGVMLAEFGGASSALAVDDRYVYAAATLDDDAPDRALVRIPIAGGALEQIADVGFRIAAIANDGDGLVVAGRDIVDHLAVVRVGKQPGGTLTPIGSLFAGAGTLARGGDTLYLTADGKLYTVGAKLTEIEVDGASLMPLTLAASRHHLYAVDADVPQQILVLDPGGKIVQRLGASGPIRSLVAAYDDDTFFVVTDHAVTRYTVTPETLREYVELNDLKAPIAIAYGNDAIVSTAGGIAHMPDYDGAIVYRDDNGVYVAYRGDAVALAVADRYLFALRGGPVVRHPHWARHQLIRMRFGP